MKSLSERGKKLAENPARIDMELFIEASQNTYHPIDNPEGTFTLNVAENSISADLINKRIIKVLKESEPPAWVLKYTSSLGHPEVREIIAGFMQNYFNSAINAQNIALSAGASASLELSSFVLANPGDVVVIPAPSYPMYTKDLGIKSLIERYDLQTHFELEDQSSLALVNVAQLAICLDYLRSKGKVFKILLITSPDNPSGSVYSIEQLREIATWCMDHKIHLIVNEIYALSQFDMDLKDGYPSSERFRSFANIIAESNSKYLHLIYALSKDFAMSGFRVGIIHTLNEKFIKALDNVNIPHMVSNLTQWLIGELFLDEKFIDHYVKENRKRISQNYLLTVKLLEKLGVPYIPNRGSLFLWADFSGFLKEDTQEAEMGLWMDLYKKTSILLTPGLGFQHKKNGLFRIVHTAVIPDHLEVAYSRLRTYFEAVKNTDEF